MVWIVVLDAGLQTNVAGWFFDNALRLEDELVLRVAGVLLAGLGAVLTSPHGWKRMVFLTGFWLKSKYIQIQMWLSKYLKFIRRPPTIVRATSASASAGALSARVVAENRIPPEATTEEKLVIMEVALRNLQNLVNSDYENLNNKVTEVKSLLGEVSEKTAELHTKMIKAQEEAASIDAAGIPVIAAGILLSGIPRELAIFPIAGWITLTLSIVLAYAMTRKTIRDGAWGKKGSEA